MNKHSNLFGHPAGFLVFISVIISASMNLRADTGGNQHWTSAAGHYRVSYSTSLDPIEINKIHSWILHVKTANGEPLQDADITLEGGMPMHNHGLPTQPQVSQVNANGDYKIEGMRFHMMGQWEIKINITAQGNTDSVVVPLNL